jgi:hypothetical protein
MLWGHKAMLWGHKAPHRANWMGCSMSGYGLPP